MSGITVPAGWQKAKLGDLIQLEYGKSLPAKVRDSNGPVVVYGSSGPVGVHSEAIVSGPAVVVGRKGNVGSVFLSNEDFWPIDTAYFVRETPCADIRFLYYLLQSLRLERLDRSTAIPGLNRDDAYDLPVLLSPLAEQRRIVEKIETLFAELDKGEESLRQVQTLLARYRQSVLKAAVTGELTADWRAERAGKLEHGRDLLERILQTRRETWEGRGSFKEPTPPATDRLPDLPDGWIWCSTEQLAQVQTGATPRKSESRFYAGGTVPWITSTAVNSELITEPQDFITDAAIAETNAKLFPAGTLIVAMYGEGKTRGKVSQLGIDAATNQACAALLVEHLPEAVRDFLKTFYIYNYESIRLLSSGGVQPNLNLGLISRTAVPLASEEELSEIGRQIETEFMRIREAEEHCEAAGRCSVALRQSILKDAFSGRLVPQDPTDEPASELLARIRQSRDPGQGGSRRRKSAVAGA